jgi:hypothetical protein
MRHGLVGLILSALAAGVADLAAQSAYPVPPRPLPDAEEIALATSAAPPVIAAGADVYVIRASGPVKLRAGTNGLACMVSRDLHDGSRYPICFDREAAATVMQREMLENRLRTSGLDEAKVQERVQAAFADGTLRQPSGPAMAYMMSPRQVLFSESAESGRRVGAWHPHLMLYLPRLTRAQLGLDTADVDVLQLDHSGEPDALLVVKVPAWSDGTAAH